MKKILHYTISVILGLSILTSSMISAKSIPSQISNKSNYVNANGTVIKDRISIPKGFKRVPEPEGSFAAYLRTLPLKPNNAKVLFYDGTVKPNNVYQAVFNIDIGKKDLLQCADAVIKLRSEYLYQKKQYKDIHFNFTNGFKADYSMWMKGYRIAVNGNKVKWIKKYSFSNSYESFQRYLEIVYAYAGTLSLSKELKLKDLRDMRIGDVFIKGGSPGHCEIIVDIAVNNNTGEKIFLLAQSFMPAQNIQLLINPVNSNLSPWYSIKFGNTLYTPEWAFNYKDLMTFE